MKSNADGNDDEGRTICVTTEDDGLSAIDNAMGTAPTRSVTGLGTLCGGAGGTRGAVGTGTGTPSRRRHIRLS